MKREVAMEKKNNSMGWTASDIASLCRLMVAEARRAKRTKRPREGLKIALAVIDRVIRELLFDLEERATAAGVLGTRFLLEAIEEAREENARFMNIGHAPSLPLVPVHVSKVEKANKMLFAAGILPKWQNLWLLRLGMAEIRQ